MRGIKLFFVCVMTFLWQGVSSQTARVYPTFHAIIFADTEDGRIGRSTELDKNNVSSMLVEVQSSLKEHMEFVYYIYPENYCSPENLRKVLKNIKCKSDDVVFFYYSGHGVRSVKDTSRYPQMCLGLPLQEQSRMISVEGVDKAIGEKNPRLRFVITDCCNSADEFVAPKLEISKGSSIINSKKEGNYQKLFLNKYGNVIVTSSEAGETSSCNNQIGGFFTYCFLAVLEEAINKNVSDWNLIMETVKEATVNISSNKMHPVYEIYLSDKPISPMPSPTDVNSINESEMIVTQSELLSDLLKLIDVNVGAQRRLDMVGLLLNRHFASDGVWVETIGRDSRTVVNRENARDYLERLATSFFLTNFNILTVKKNSDKKIVSLRIHEVYNK